MFNESNRLRSDILNYCYVAARAIRKIIITRQVRCGGIGRFRISTGFLRTYMYIIIIVCAFSAKYRRDFTAKIIG